jgi:signal transduction histidine kinase
VYAEADEHEVSVFVRDRGAGFDRSAVPADRRGISESIEARLVRAGGSATITSTPGEGTEVELRLERKP